ncbi:tetratricopeptide repeat protein [Flavobacterium litorale]|uniref:Tetratricopeptide repeat protein n=1 Tax=Flavobacterium litorale TaxID=2856519 RepID=A0ABX8V7Q0_9FLAO|nr:tetratricopeptide repeat protein [Flavobacterium litorale]QYJ68772.1 tetratricopeptide repeat protein [Flavobacterium litorale]
MDEGLYKPINLHDFIKESPLLNPFKEYYPDYLGQLLERTFHFWDLEEIEKAKEQIAIYNSNFEGFHLGILIELAIDFDNLDAEKTIIYLNSIPENHRNEPDIGDMYYRIKAALYFSLLDIDLAIEECVKGIGFGFGSEDLYYLRAMCSALRNLHNQAIPDYIIALKRNFNTDEIIANLAYSYLRVRKMRKAFKLHKSVVDKFPGNHKIQYNTGLCYKHFRKYSKAVEYFDKAIALNPDEAGYRLTRGRVLMRLKRHNEAQLDLVYAQESDISLAEELLNINTEVLERKITSRTANKKVLKLLRRIYLQNEGY